MGTGDRSPSSFPVPHIHMCTSAGWASGIALSSKADVLPCPSGVWWGSPTGLGHPVRSADFFCQLK